MSLDLFIGIDGGATAAKLVLIDSKGNKIENSSTGSCNKNNIGIKQAQQNIFDGIKLLLSLSNKSINNVRGICLSTAGITTEKDKNIWNTILKNWLNNFNKNNNNIKYSIETHNDTIGIIASVLPQTMKGIVIIVGTGFIVSGFDGNPNKEYRAGGWGPLLGDVSSGYNMGEKMLTAAAVYYDIVIRKNIMQNNNLIKSDDNDSKTDENNEINLELSKLLVSCGGSEYLYKKIIEKTRIKCFDEIIDWCYNNDNNYKRVASIVPILFEKESNDDIICQQILNNSIDFLVNRVLILLEKLYPKNIFYGKNGKEIINIVCGGSIITKQEQFAILFEKRLRYKLGGDGRQSFIKILKTKQAEMGAAQYIRYKYQNMK